MSDKVTVFELNANGTKHKIKSWYSESEGTYKAELNGTIGHGSSLQNAALDAANEYYSEYD